MNLIINKTVFTETHIATGTIYVNSFQALETLPAVTANIAAGVNLIMVCSAQNNEITQRFFARTIPVDIKIMEVVNFEEPWIAARAAIPLASVPCCFQGFLSLFSPVCVIIVTAIIFGCRVRQELFQKCKWTLFHKFSLFFEGDKWYLMGHRRFI